MGQASIFAAFSILLVLTGTMGCIVFVPPPKPPTTTTQPSTTTTSTEAPCVCGVPNSNDRRIVGGQPAEKNEYPWLVRLVRFSGSLLCGGSLISSNTVLTAAHCYRDPSSIRAVVQDHDVTQDDGEIIIDVSLFITHPNYDSSTSQYEFDFAIVRLVQQVTFTKTISPVCLPRIGQNYEQREAVVVGWGTLESFGSLPDILQEAEVTILTNKQCTTNTQYEPFQITDDMICAAKPGKDSCQGDSGGPLLGYEGGGRYFSVVGLVSWGYGCALSDAPGVYARVTNQLDWIRDNIEGSTCPAP